jgi:hypothetical protein
MCKICVNMAGAGILAVSLGGILHSYVLGHPPNFGMDMVVALIGMAVGASVPLQKKSSSKGGKRDRACV